MRHYIKIEGQKVFLEGDPQLLHDSEGELYWVQNLDNAQKGRFLNWDTILVEGNEFKVKSEI